MLLSRLLGWGDLSGFFDEMKALSNTESHKDLMESVSKGQYTLRDMYKQFQSMMTMGPMNKMMEMMPGMESIAPLLSGEDGKKQFKTFLYIMDRLVNHIYFPIYTVLRSTAVFYLS
jgi:signal recognition particle subunit SRP54